MTSFSSWTSKTFWNLTCLDLGTAKDYYAVLDFECTCDSSTTERTGTDCWMFSMFVCLLFGGNLRKSAIHQEVQTWNHRISGGLLEFRNSGGWLLGERTNHAFKNLSGLQRFKLHNNRSWNFVISTEDGVSSIHIYENECYRRFWPVSYDFAVAVTRPPLLNTENSWNSARWTWSSIVMCGLQKNLNSRTGHRVVSQGALMFFFRVLRFHLTHLCFLVFWFSERV